MTCLTDHEEDSVQITDLAPQRWGASATLLLGILRLSPRLSLFDSAQF